MLLIGHLRDRPGLTTVRKLEGHLGVDRVVSKRCGGLRSHRGRHFESFLVANHGGGLGRTRPEQRIGPGEGLSVRVTHSRRTSQTDMGRQIRKKTRRDALTPRSSFR
jgi:hypothetical protein